MVTVVTRMAPGSYRVPGITLPTWQVLTRVTLSTPFTDAETESRRAPLLCPALGTLRSSGLERGTTLNPLSAGWRLVIQARARGSGPPW